MFPEGGIAYYCRRILGVGGGGWGRWGLGQGYTVRPTSSYSTWRIETELFFLVKFFEQRSYTERTKEWVRESGRELMLPFRIGIILTDPRLKLWSGSENLKLSSKLLRKSKNVRTQRLIILKAFQSFLLYFLSCFNVRICMDTSSTVSCLIRVAQCPAWYD